MAARYRIILVRSLVANIRAEIIPNLQILSVKYFDTRGMRMASAKILMDVDRMQGFFEWIMAGLLQAVLGLAFVIPLLSTFNGPMTLIAVLYVPTIPPIQHAFRKMLTKRSYELCNTNVRFSGKLIDYITGIKHIRTFATEDKQGARLSTIKKADRVFVFKDWTIVEQGGFNELLGVKGAFAEMVKANISGVHET